LCSLAKANQKEEDIHSREGRRRKRIYIQEKGEVLTLEEDG